MCDRFPRKFDVQTSYMPSNYVLGLIFVVNIKFPRATYHTIMPSAEKLYCLDSSHTSLSVLVKSLRVYTLAALICCSSPVYSSQLLQS